MERKNTASRLEKLNLLGSIRAKYILTFALLISIGFVLLSLIVSSLITNYTIESKQLAMDDSAQIVYSTIKTVTNTTGKSYVEAIRYYDDYFSGVLGNLATMNETVIILTDENGEIISHSETATRTRILLENIPKNEFSQMLSGSTSTKHSSLSGLYGERHINYSYPVLSDTGMLEGLILISTPIAGVQSFLSELIKTMVISFLWITLAAVVVSIFISERITSPLKELEKAAKSYSHGNFDVQVAETGVDNEVAALAGAFNEMSKVIKENEMQRRSFLGSVSHDMRTPMTSIAGFVDGILDGTIPPEKQEYYLKIVSAETHRLSRLVNSLLDITRIQSGERKFNMAEFDLCELLRLVLISMEAQIEAKNLEIEFDPCADKCTVFADSDGIHQVAYNIIHNAIKFTDDGGKIKISIDKYEGKKYLVTIYNTGKGMKKEELPYVFDRFYKADPSRGLDKSGAGLGLFIVKTILGSHGQKIWVESEEGKYCAFKFTLPTKPQNH